MKSKRAKEFIESSVWAGKVTTNQAWEAVELAEAELEEQHKAAIYQEGFWQYKSGWHDMKEKAIEAHRNRCQTCAVSTHERICGDRRRVKSVADFGIVCDDECSYMQDFLAALDNDKPIKTE